MEVGHGIFWGGLGAVDRDSRQGASCCSECRAARCLSFSGKGMGKKPVVARASLTSCQEGSEHLVAELKQFS